MYFSYSNAFSSFTVQVDKDVLFSLVAAANFLDIKQLLDLTCLAVSILIKGKSAAELRDMFNISAELTAEETAQIQQDNNQWTAAAEGGGGAAGGEGGAAAPQGDDSNNSNQAEQAPAAQP